MRKNVLKKLSKDDKITIRESVRKIMIEKKDHTISYEKALYKIEQGICGLIVGHIVNPGDENLFHCQGYKNIHNYCIYNISTIVN